MNGQAANCILGNILDGAWGWEWGAHNLGPLCACVTYCLPLGWNSCWQSAKTCCACYVCRIDND